MKLNILSLYLQHEVEYLESVALSLAHLGHVEVQHTQGRNLHLLTLLILKIETSLYILHFSLRVNTQVIIPNIRAGKSCEKLRATSFTVFNFKSEIPDSGKYVLHATFTAFKSCKLSKIVHKLVARA